MMKVKSKKLKVKMRHTIEESKKMRAKSVRYFTFYLLPFTLLLAFCLLPFAFAVSAHGETAMMHSFSGLLTPKLGARSDILKYYSGCQDLDNMFVKPQGGVTKRPGTYYIATIPEEWTVTEEVPAVPPAKIRDEAYIITNDVDIVWLDPNFAVLSYESANVGTVCGTVDVTDDGIVIAGYGTPASSGPCITRWATDLTPSTVFFTPTAGWQSTEWVGALRLTDDDTYMYAVGNRWRIYKFNVATGAEEWNVFNIVINGYSMAVDSDDNVYVATDTKIGNYGVIRKYGSDGSAISDMPIGNFQHDIEVDLPNERLYTCGYTIQIWGGTIPFLTYHQIGAIDFDGGNHDYYSLDGLNAATIWNIVKIGDYIYAAGDRTQAGGSWGSVYKFDTSLNLIASYDTALNSFEIWGDHEGNIAVKSGYYDGGDANAGVWLLDTDLNYIADYRVDTDEVYGGEAHNVPYMDSGTAAVPGWVIENDFGEGEPTPVRLIDFVASDEVSYVVVMGNEHMTFIKGDL